MSRTTRESSRQTSLRSWPDSTARSASANAAGPSSAITASISPNSRSRPTRPSTVETSSTVIVCPANAITWSSALCASRMLPSAARAISASPASGTSTLSASAIFRSCAVIARAEIVRNSNTCDRDRIVSGILCSSVVAIMKTTCDGRLLDRLEQRVERLRRELVDFVDDEDLVAIADRRDRQPGDDDLADVVDPGVAGGVDLEDVDVAPLRDLDARVARRRTAPRSVP